jgi:hypothetical protein
LERKEKRKKAESRSQPGGEQQVVEVAITHTQQVCDDAVAGARADKVVQDARLDAERALGTGVGLRSGSGQYLLSVLLRLSLYSLSAIIGAQGAYATRSSPPAQQHSPAKVIAVLFWSVLLFLSFTLLLGQHHWWCTHARAQRDPAAFVSSSVFTLRK